MQATTASVETENQRIQFIWRITVHIVTLYLLLGISGDIREGELEYSNCVPFVDRTQNKWGNHAASSVLLSEMFRRGELKLQQSMVLR